ncbi:hypothetical protein [Superficieibacter sp. HKU1]|uniref:hypothetical protein n=1 Tax=Superficieibacter sp. HKU1 TaxID=3031919 RepID=UPI0023E30D08|nr:hypothetical protein [Superficieibacter sp. HKU1]WES70401.1 hypothetical protein P0H77_10710 [Superficieibacter sp. HKU1]
MHGILTSADLLPCFVNQCYIVAADQDTACGDFFVGDVAFGDVFFVDGTVTAINFSGIINIADVAPGRRPPYMCLIERRKMGRIFNYQPRFIRIEGFMKKILLAVAFCALVSCSHSSYTEATRADGSSVKHVTIAPGTKITIANGDCIDSTGTLSTCPVNGL